MKTIPDVVVFPTNAESSPFFAALASTLLPALDYTEETPYFCAPKNSNCVQCGNCKSNTLQKHHVQLYHDYQSFTGVGLGWCWPEDATVPYQTFPDGGAGWDWPDSFFDYIMGVAGLTWKRLDKASGKDEIFKALAASVDAGIPALMKLGQGADWHVVTGYDDAGMLYGLDAHKYGEKPVVTPERYIDNKLFELSNWVEPFVTAIVITGKCEPTLKLPDILTCMITILEHPQHAILEAEITRRIDAIGPDNALETAKWLNQIVGFPIEARWHVADSSLQRMTDNETAKERLFHVIEHYVFDNDLDATHGTCWKIWAQLGVGTDTGYATTPKSAELVQQPQAQAELKRLFAIVFENDRLVLGFLREALAAIAG